MRKALIRIGSAILLILTATLTVAASPTGARSPVGLVTRAGCNNLQPSDVGWVTLTANGEIDQQVSSYPSGVNTITPVFRYACVPQGTTIVSVFTFNGETVLTNKESLKPSTRKGIYQYPIGYADDTALDEGEWGAQFFNGKTLLTEGTVMVGEAAEAATPTQAVSVQGTVKDKKTKKPIKGATVLVLQPGVSLDSFIKGGQKDSDVFTAGQTDSQGEFALAAPLARGETYAIIIVAKGYKATANNALTVATDAPDPITLTVTMTK